MCDSPSCYQLKCSLTFKRNVSDQLTCCDTQCVVFLLPDFSLYENCCQDLLSPLIFYLYCLFILLFQVVLKCFSALPEILLPQSPLYPSDRPSLLIQPFLLSNPCSVFCHCLWCNVEDSFRENGLERTEFV